MIKCKEILEIVLQNCISREYFIKVLNWIFMINLISGIIAICVILFLYKLWKKSQAANEILYIENLNMKREMEDGGTQKI